MIHRSCKIRVSNTVYTPHEPLQRLFKRGTNTRHLNPNITTTKTNYKNSLLVLYTALR